MALRVKASHGGQHARRGTELDGVARPSQHAGAHGAMLAFDFGRQLESLAGLGLNWLAFVPQAQGPAIPASVPSPPDSGLLIFVSFGAAFGEQTEFAAPSSPDPFDARSRELVTGFGQHLCAALPRPFELLYPSPAPLDLRGWLEAGAVQFRSPIGIGIRPDCGPWLAVRAAAWTMLSDDELVVLRARYPQLQPEDNPCLDCKGTPCVDACPPRAVSPPFAAAPMQAKSLTRCLEQRLQPHSACALQCLSRNACPVGRARRYPEAQMRYHYRASLTTIRRWRKQE